MGDASSALSPLLTHLAEVTNLHGSRYPQALQNFEPTLCPKNHQHDQTKSLLFSPSLPFCSSFSFSFFFISGNGTTIPPVAWTRNPALILVYILDNLVPPQCPSNLSTIKFNYSTAQISLKSVLFFFLFHYHCFNLVLNLFPPGSQK